LPQHRSFTHKVFLADKFGEGLGTHAFGKGSHV
jgi:hypothetical protein